MHDQGVALARAVQIRALGMPPQLFALDTDRAGDTRPGAGARYQGLLADCEAALCRVVDPEAADALAKADQRARIAAMGGREAIMRAATSAIRRRLEQSQSTTDAVAPTMATLTRVTMRKELLGTPAALARLPQPQSAFRGHWHSDVIDPIFLAGMTGANNGDGNSSRKTARRRDAATRRLPNALSQRQPSPTLKPKERPASKGRVHKGRTRN